MMSALATLCKCRELCEISGIQENVSLYEEYIAEKAKPFLSPTGFYPEGVAGH